MDATIRQLKFGLSENSDTLSKVSLLNQLSRAYMYKDNEMVLHYANEALHLATQLNDKKHICKAYVNKAAYEFINQNYKNGILYYHKAFSNLENDYESEVRVYYGISNIYRMLEISNKSLNYLEKALKISEEHHLYKEVAACYNNMGRVYSTSNEYQLANICYDKAIQISTEHNFNTLEGYVRVNKIKNQLTANQIDFIENDLFQLEDLIDKHNEFWYIGMVQCLWGLYYSLNDITDYAKERFELGIKILEDEEQYYYLFEAYIDYGKILYNNNKILQAKSILERGAIRLENYKIENHPYFFKEIANFYTKISDHKSSLKYLKKYETSKYNLEVNLNKYF